MGQDRYPGDKEMTLRLSCVGLATLVIALIAFQVEYPWSVYYRGFDFGKWQTMFSYLLVSIAFALLSMLVAGAVLKDRRRSATRSAILCSVTIFVVAILLSLLFGPGGLNLPGTRVRGIFFAEWRFLSFLPYVAAPVAFTAGLVCGWPFRSVCA
jgi:uncharacterized membrane protein YozB (DUF420 family)